MPIHEEVLRAALRLCRERGQWTFRIADVVRALPHLPENSVRTHVASRCCVNAPPNHPHRWPYFRRVSRGTYEIRRPYRNVVLARTSRERMPMRGAVAEGRSTYRARDSSALADTIHAVVRRSGGWYTAECLEIPVVTQARTLDELAGNLAEAVELHLEGEDLRDLGLVPHPRVALIYHLPRG